MNCGYVRARIASYLLLLTLIATRSAIVPTQPTSNTELPNGAQGIAHFCVLAPPSVFTEVATEPTAIVGGPLIKEDRDGEEEAGRPRELVWVVDLSGGQRSSYAVHMAPTALAARVGYRGRGGIEVCGESWCGAG